MAGMFYSLQEVIEKMQATKERIDELVRDGRLREFRDGPNLLFKVDEVEALMADTSFMTAEQPSPPEPQTDQEPLLVDLEPAETAAEPPELTEEDTIAVPGEEGIVPEEVEAAAEPIPEITADISGQEAEAAEEISLEPESAEVESSQKGLSDADTSRKNTLSGRLFFWVPLPVAGCTRRLGRKSRCPAAFNTTHVCIPAVSTLRRTESCRRFCPTANAHASTRWIPSRCPTGSVSVNRHTQPRPQPR